MEGVYVAKCVDKREVSPNRTQRSAEQRGAKATHLDTQPPFLTTKFLQSHTTLLPNLSIIPPGLNTDAQLGLPFRKLSTLPLLLLRRPIDSSQLLYRVIITRQSSSTSRRCPSHYSRRSTRRNIKLQSPMTPSSLRHDYNARAFGNSCSKLLDVFE